VSEDDREAVRRVQAGDTEAFEPLVEKYKRKVFRLAYQVLRDQEEALDVAQEAFVKAFRALPAFKGDSAFYTWLFRITMNVALDRKRQRATRAKSLGADDVPPEEWERTATSTDPDPEDVATGAERRERIRKGLDSLSEHHRAIIILSDIEGLQYREIAEVLGIPMGTVMSRLHHARKRLRDVLGPMLTLLLVVLAASLLAVSRPSTAGAQPPQIVRFSVQVLLASDTEAPSAAALPEDLRRLVPRLYQLFRYKQYQVLQQYQGQAPVGGVQRWPVPGERMLEISPDRVSGESARLEVRLQRGAVMELSMTMRVMPGAPVVIGGPRHGDGVLIVILMTIR
jgi:RNA polymerase sigma-70 factor (ECF subfamily)